MAEELGILEGVGQDWRRYYDQLRAETKVLVVDDEPLVYEVVEAILDSAGFEVEVAEKGKDTYTKRVGIERLHREEDAGKLVHAGSDRLAGSTHSLVDYNRAGVALAVGAIYMGATGNREATATSH